MTYPTISSLLAARPELGKVAEVTSERIVCDGCGAELTTAGQVHESGEA
jgi:hypothetical protein